MDRKSRSNLPRVRYVVKFANGMYSVFDTHSYRPVAVRDLRKDAEGYAVFMNKKG